MNFIGRENELQALSGLKSKKNAIAVIYGRRRIGKSFLIREFLKNSEAIHFEGLEGQSKKQQLKNFILQLNHQTDSHFAHVKSWSEAFLYLEKVLKVKPAWIVLDEFQWMGNYRSEIVSELKMVWDQYLSHIPNVSLILCGSIASFMTSKVIKSKSMYGRTDKIIHLKEFNLSESRKMVPAYGIQELLDAQMIFGGVPKYLELVRDFPSLYTAIDELGFKENGYFVNEFDRIFVSHFGQNEDYKKIIDALAKHPYGLFRKEIIQESGIDAGGGLSNHLKNLESAGFISIIHPVDKSVNTHILKYYLSDAYLSFYYAFIKPNKAQISRGPSLTFSALAQQGSFHNWRGRAFERLCQQHSTKIAEILGFPGINYRMGPYFRAPKERTPGIQIDIIFDRDDNVLTLCELKTSRSLIGTEVIDEIEHKKEMLKITYPRHTIQPVFIYDGRISNDLMNSPYIYKKINAVELI